MATICLWFPLYKERILLRYTPSQQSTSNIKDIYKNLSVYSGMQSPTDAIGMLHKVGEYNGLPCMAYEASLEGYELENYDLKNLATIRKDSLFTISLRDMQSVIGVELYSLAGKGAQLIFWDKRSTYCSVCGALTDQVMPNAKRCPACANEFYPVVTPAVLALVQKEDQILLVQGREFKRPFFSVVAGFVEPGESLEECVKREVLEETNITVENIRYFGSQPWPFPSNLMIGFMADYKSGELKLQEEEILAGGFYSKDSLPTLPQGFSLARQMIDSWISS